MSMITNPDGSQEIRDPDGSVYMTLPAPRPGGGDLIGYRVRTLTNGSHKCGVAVGTRSSLTDDVMSERELLRLIATLRGDYGDPVVSGVRMGPGRSFRWAWEETVGGHRLTDVVIATRI